MIFQISVDLPGVEDEQYDDSNLLVLPSKKRKTKLNSEKEQIAKKLSKKQRKRLEQVIDRKKKKAKVLQ